MANEGGAIPATVLGTIGQVNGILGAAITLLATYKAARAAWRAAHPDEDSPFMEDAQIIDLLAADGAALVDHANRILAKHADGAAA